MKSKNIWHIKFENGRSNLIYSSLDILSGQFLNVISGPASCDLIGFVIEIIIL